MDISPLYKSVLPILQYEERSNAVNIAGTAVLVELMGLPFLITAGHVLRVNGRQYPLYLSLEDKSVGLDVPAILSKSDNDVDIDVGVFGLMRFPELMEALKNCKPTSLDEPRPMPGYSELGFFILGFPWRRARYDKEERVIDIKPLRYKTDMADDSYYRRHRRSKDDFLIVRYTAKATNGYGRKVTPPNPEGASGGPVFRVLGSESDPYLFVFEGIMTERKGREVIISTRKSAIRKFIKDCLISGML